MTPLQYLLTGIGSFIATSLLAVLWRHGQAISRQLTALDRKATRVESILIGPDGQNGVRGDVTRIVEDMRTVNVDRSALAVWQKGIEMLIAQSTKERMELVARVAVLEKVGHA